MTPFTNSPSQIGSLIHQNFATPQQKSPKVYRYAYLDKEAINATIQNAMRAANEFNKAQKEKSSSIIKINQHLRKAAKDQKHTIKQRVLHKEFIAAEGLRTADPETYNSAMLKFNRNHSTNFLMREWPTLKNELATFNHLVIFFAAQVRDNNARKMNAGVSTTGILPRLRTNSESLRRYKVEGVPQCRFKNEAILRHVHALVEAGILVNYKNHGPNVGFSVEFSPEILEVKDHDPAKSQNTAKQIVTKSKTCKAGYSGLVTGTVLNNHENKGDASPSPEIRIGASAPDLPHKNTYQTTYKNNNKTTGSVTNPQEQANRGADFSPEKNAVHRKPTESDKLTAQIRDQWQLCKELEADHHTQHIPIDGRILEKEAQNGTMSQQFFRMLLFQEFMKYISRLKLGNQSAAGAFFNAFEELFDKKMITFTGKYFTKTAMLDEFHKWIWMVDCAERWGKKRNWDFLYINDYLDTARRDAKEMGFWYLEKQWNANERKKATRKAKRKANQEAHGKRKIKIKAERLEKYGLRSIKPGTNSRARTDYEKARMAVRRFLKKEIQFDELYRYCQANLNETIVTGLENLIASERKNLTLKK
ncbi:hypothetical protein [Aequorivita echinoideorum]|uniref:Uncharacterized protein n=1 Tax=Aequorivita echinoideorum TaxID=1549647 RepID=A0ABS5S6Z1_9FLAO|nr:hypothetical protein [Aequorivita echinoideorum]MBT0607615.1 hypothetical protein [Aequorivita echinoideorum]